MRVLIIAHPIAGIDKKKREILKKITTNISDNRGSVDITYTMKPGVGEIYSSRAALEGYDAVFAAGGDGTVNDVAAGLVGRSIPMGIIPLGTGNGLARSLGIPFDTEKLIDVLSKKKTMYIDAGKISSKIFTATAGLGYDAAIAHEFNRQLKSTRKMYKYFYIAVKNYFFKSPETLSLTADGTVLKRKVFALTIANVSQYGGGAQIAPGAAPDSGSLLAVLVPKFNVFRAIPMIVKLFKGSIGESGDIEYVKFKNLEIRREKAGFCHADGETFECDKIIDVTVIPHALQVIVP